MFKLRSRRVQSEAFLVNEYVQLNVDLIDVADFSHHKFFIAAS